MAKRRTSTKTAREEITHDPTAQVAIRVPLSWLEYADRLATQLSHSGVPLKRADGFRAAMAAGFDRLLGLKQSKKQLTNGKSKHASSRDL
jgi:hypothetical protein